MATPESLTFEGIPLTGDMDGDDTSSLGGSERTIGNWTIRLLDTEDNVGSPLTEFLDVISDDEESVLVNPDDLGLRVLGTLDTIAAAEFASTDGSKFWLKSFHIDNYGMGTAENGVYSDTVRVVGYADGVEVVHQDFDVKDFDDTLVTLQGELWRSIDTFRIVQPDGAADIAFVIDDIIVDDVPVPPAVTSVSSTAADGVYAVGDAITITVTFDQAVEVTGMPLLRLETGATDRNATYAGGSGSNTLTFTYTVQEGDTAADLDYLSNAALELNAGTIATDDGVAALLALAAPGAAGSLGGNKAIAVDGVRPTAAIVVADDDLVAGETSTVTITFSEAVTGLSTADFSVANGSLSGLASSDGGKTWTATLTAKAGVTDATNLITLYKAGIADLAGNAGTGKAVSNNYAVERAPNAPPQLTGDLKATVKEGGSYKLTTADLNFSDTDDSAAGVRFTVSALSNGKVYVNGKAASSFTGTELAAGKVSFVHTGSETTKAAFKVSVEDGNEDGSTPVAKSFNLTVTPVNDVPTLVAGQTLSQIAEDAWTGAARKVATLSVSDPDGGSNRLSLTGSDAKLFEIANGALWLKKGAKLDYETNRSLDVTVRLDDPSIGTGHEASKSFKIAVTDAMEEKYGTSGNDRLSGTSGKDALYGKGGNDVVTGGAGNDRLNGGSGVDLLTGGADRDTFVFAAVNHSGLGNDRRDTITDFVHAQDKLDISAIDANSHRSGNQDFVWSGKGGFDGKAGELVFRTFDEKGTKNDRTVVYGDTDHDRHADFQIELTGIINLTKGDFIL